MKNVFKNSKEIVGNSLRHGLSFGLLGGLVIGGISALFISAPFTSLFIFGAAVGGALGGGGYALGNMVEGMWTTGDTSRINRKILSGALLLTASATALYFNGTPRSAAQKEQAAQATTTFNCAANQNRVEQLVISADGKRTLTVSCQPR